MKKTLLWAGALFIWLGASTGAAKVKIVTTTTNLAALARAVGGDDVSVESLTKGTRDPHFVAAKPSMIRKIYAAELLLSIGVDQEIAWLPAALQAGRNARVQPGQSGYLDLSEAVTLLDVPTGLVTRAMGDVHAKGNPHYLLDPRNGARAAVAIAARLEAIDPENADGYRDRLGAFAVALDQKIADWDKRLAPLKGRPVVSHHKTFSYLADAFGFRVADYVEPLPGIAPTAAHLARLTARITEQQITLLIMAPYYDLRPARYLAENTGITVVVLPQAVEAIPEIKTYFDLFDAIIAALSRNQEGP